MKPYDAFLEFVNSEMGGIAYVEGGTQRIGDAKVQVEAKGYTNMSIASR